VAGAVCIVVHADSKRALQWNAAASWHRNLYHRSCPLFLSAPHTSLRWVHLQKVIDVDVPHNIAACPLCYAGLPSVNLISCFELSADVPP
jgi:hypothetical protein